MDKYKKRRFMIDLTNCKDATTKPWSEFREIHTGSESEASDTFLDWLLYKINNDYEMSDLYGKTNWFRSLKFECSKDEFAGYKSKFKTIWEIVSHMMNEGMCSDDDCIDLITEYACYNSDFREDVCEKMKKFSGAYSSDLVIFLGFLTSEFPDVYLTAISDIEASGVKSLCDLNRLGIVTNEEVWKKFYNDLMRGNI